MPTINLQHHKSTVRLALLVALALREDHALLYLRGDPDLQLARDLQEQEEHHLPLKCPQVPTHCRTRSTSCSTC